MLLMHLRNYSFMGSDGFGFGFGFVGHEYGVGFERVVDCGAAGFCSVVHQ